MVIFMLSNGKCSIIATMNTCLCNTKGEIKFYGADKIGECHLSDCLTALCDFDAPDGYSIVEDSMYVIEHFQFDSTKSTKSKGSSTRR